MKILKTFLPLCILCLLFDTAFAKNYYFSSSGSDSNGCTIGSPCSSPQKAASLATLPGDSLLFQCGGTYYIPLNFTHSGTASQPIVISSYGTGAQPIFTVAPTTSWTGPSAGVYSKTVKNHPGTIVFYEDGLPVIPEASSSALTDGRWYGNGTTLYYKPLTGTASNHVLSFANLGAEPGYIPAIDLSGCSYVTVNNINITAVGIGIKTFEVAAGTTGLTVQNCNFSYCQRAIFVMPGPNGNTNMTIQNNYFSRCQCAVNLYTYTAEGTNTGSTAGTNTGCSILNNEMSQIGTIDGTTHWNVGTDFEGIGLQNFMNGTIKGNYIHDGFQIGLSWYNITTRESSNNKIIGNTWSNTGKGAMLLIGDQVGGVYNYGYSNNWFYNNVIINSVYSGVFDGSVVFYQGALTTGQNYFVNNTLSGNKNLVYFPTTNPPYFTIENNIVYNSGSYQFVNWSWTAKPATLTMDYNLYYQDAGNVGTNTGWALIYGRPLAFVQRLGLELHSKVANPIFVSAPANNYHLQSGSPAIAAGVNVGLPFTGAAPDCGAYPYATPSTSGTTTTPATPVKPANPSTQSGTPVVY